MEPAAIQQDSGRNRGGRPPLSPAPTSASDTRALIAQEIVKTKPSASRLRYLRALLESFEDAESEAKAEAAEAVANPLQQQANELEQAELEQKRLEYQRRRDLGEQRRSADGNKMSALQEENASLRQKNAILTAKLSEQEASMKKLQVEFSELQNKFCVLNTEMADLKRLAEEWASIKAAVQSELKSVCNPEERITVSFSGVTTINATGALRKP
jgi:Rad3-related DNA helicase